MIGTLAQDSLMTLVDKQPLPTDKPAKMTRGPTDGRKPDPGQRPTVNEMAFHRIGIHPHDVKNTRNYFAVPSRDSFEKPDN